MPQLSPELAAQLFADEDALAAKVMAVQARRSGSRSFAAFVKQAWQYCPQVDPLVWSWHMDVLCAHFEEVAHGRINRLLVNIPPGHAKSVLLAVLWPAWVWTWWPKCQFLFASHAAELAIRDSVRCRAIIESDWYREMYSDPGGWELAHDQNAKGYFVNTAGGERYSTGIGGTGRRAHIIGIDDPLAADARHSKAARDEANDWIGHTLSQRFVDAQTGRVAMIMQRLHEEDPAGFVLSGGGWEHLMLPSEFEEQRRAVTYHHVEKRNGHVERVRQEYWRDPRKVEGELLFPQKFPREVLERYKRVNELGEEGYSSQHRQNPTPAGGGMFKIDNWRFWKHDQFAQDQLASRPRGAYQGAAVPMIRAALERVIVSVDATFKQTETGSYVAIHVWGRSGSRRFLLDRVHERMDFTQTCNALVVVCGRWPEAAKKLIERAANGEAILSALGQLIPGLVGVPAVGDKMSRAAASQPYQVAGNVFLPDGAPWLAEYIAEHAAFPKGRYNDDVDAQSQALAELALEEKFAETGRVNWHLR